MRYELIGPRLKYAGKTLWEIVGNLKNFGVGRLVTTEQFAAYKESSYYKILRVQPVPPRKLPFTDRRVMVWVEPVIKGITYSETLIYKTSGFPRYQLIPRNEEDQYFKRKEEYESSFTKKEISKYIECPPLYKKLWEVEQKEKSEYKEMPPVNVVVNEAALKKVVLVDKKPSKQFESTLYVSDVPVEDMIKEIVNLKRFIKIKQRNT